MFTDCKYDNKSAGYYALYSVYALIIYGMSE